MPESAVSSNQPWVALFDLDGTLTWRDTLVQFLAAFLHRHPWRVFRLWRVPLAVASFALGDRDRGRLKSRVIRAVMGGASRSSIEACADSFVASLRPRRRFRPAALAVLEAHREAGDRLVLLSASPDLYVPRIGRLLGLERSVCTEVRWRGDRLDGALVSANRRGEEKLRCLEELRKQYPGLPVIAYGNSASDLDHMRHADRALLVNAGHAARQLARQAGIPSSTWG
jgi:phosphatidylglycerophosphatase C